jgi:hypothetical protein
MGGAFKDRESAAENAVNLASTNTQELKRMQEALEPKLFVVLILLFVKLITHIGSTSTRRSMLSWMRL